MRIRLYMMPDSCPITKEQVDRLPYPPQERDKRSVTWYSREFDPNDLSWNVNDFLLKFYPLKQEFENIWETGFECFLSFVGEGEVDLSSADLAKLSEFNVLLSVGGVKRKTPFDKDNSDGL